MTRARSLAVALLLLVLQVALGGPASAHAALVRTDPPNGVRLERAPPEVTLTFDEPVLLVPGGFVLHDGRRRVLPTGAPTTRGATVAWPMPRTMPTGTYAATWRVVSDDGHPVSGTLTFGVGVEAAPGATDIVQAPASVLLTRWLGYLGFALVVGVVVCTSVCASEGRADRGVQSLLRWGLVLAGMSTVLAVLVQGPYVVGESVLHLTDPALLSLTFASGIGFWMGWRLVGYLAVALFAWRLSWLDASTARWPTLGVLLGIAGTFSRTGHGHATSWVTPYVLTLHVLAAGIWVGGLVLLCVAPRSVSTPALPRFSRLALVSVAVLIASGIGNAVLHLARVADLWTSRYGQILSTKLVLVLLALLAAAVSRQTLRHRRSPWRSVRVEAALTVAVLAVTAWLSLTSPPPSNEHASSNTRVG